MAAETTEKRRGRTWEHEETLILLGKWGEDNIQHRLKECTRKKPIWKEVATFLQASGYEDRNADKCKTRIHTLVSSYRHYKDGASRSGNAPPKKPPFLEELDTILADNPATKPAFLLSSSSVSSDGDKSEESDEVEDVVDEVERAIEAQLVDDAEIPVLEKTKKRVKKQKDGNKAAPKKQRTTQKDVLNKVDDGLSSFLQYQQEADKKFCEEEQERERREEEREDRRRKEDQEFFLRLAQVLKKG